ncbi:MAG: hypothetical protein HY294_11900 [Candidatus Rokubacteria bacterium]|nr:hypothetical protein [Candidatus Rokubacteria bacterium]MBI3826693.1 hypothetical protein [Candidatus Rokubacteria bacterium]
MSRAAAMALVAAVAVAPATQARAELGPEALLGEWCGRWMTLSQYSEYMCLTIDRVERPVVVGRYETRGTRPERTYTGPFYGTLKGDELSFNLMRLPVTVSFEGERARGTMRGTKAPKTIELLRQR